MGVGLDARAYPEINFPEMAIFRNNQIHLCAPMNLHLASRARQLSSVRRVCTHLLGVLTGRASGTGALRGMVYQRIFKAVVTLKGIH